MADLAPDETADTAPLREQPAPVPAGLTPDTAPTEILPFEASVLAPLPDGAVLDGRYRVRGLVQQRPDRNLYRAGARGQQRCPACGALAAPETPACSRCGAHLTGEPPQQAYLIAEAYDRQTLLPDPGVLERPLNHPLVQILVDRFSYTPYGRERSYIVAEAREGVPLSQITLPQPAGRVLTWGIQLSDALGYLHEQGIRSPGASPGNMLIHEDTAVLTNLQDARPAATDPAIRAQEFAEDVGGLAGTLYETLTNRYAGAAGGGPLLPDTLPREVEDAFARALRPAPGDPPRTAAAWHALLLAARAALLAANANLRIRSGRLSDVGRHRPLNEDSLAGIECQVIQESQSAGIGVYVVADGMGGHAGGEIASALAITVSTASLLRTFVLPAFAADGGAPAGAQITTALVEAVQGANARIHAERTGRGTDMGTTLVVALVSGPTVYIANVGDSRAYLLTPGEPAPTLRQVTEDHSLVQRLVSLGQLSSEEAKHHPYRNMIYKSLGERAQLDVDTFVERIAAGTRVLLCSDGLSGMVPDPTIADILAAEPDPQVACARLISAANAAGGLDNITAIAIYVEAA